MADARQFALASPPADGVTRVAWLSPTQLVASSWDGSVTLYDAAGNARLHAFTRAGAVLDVAAAGGAAVVAGGLDMAVSLHDFASGATGVLGSHAAAVRCVEFSRARGAALSGSWDKSVRMWDARAGGGAGAPPVGAAALPDRVHAMALLGGDALIVAAADQSVHFFDLRKLAGGGGAAAETRESSLKHQTRVVRAAPDARGWASGSIEGRVAIDFVDAAHEGKFAFKVRRARARAVGGGRGKCQRRARLTYPPPPPVPLPWQCHRLKMPNGDEKIYPVNAIAYHPTHGTFVTGGADGTVCSWDGAAKKRIVALPTFGAPVTSVAFSDDGALLAVAASYDWSAGDPAALPAPPPADAIYIRTVAPAEVAPKPRA